METDCKTCRECVHCYTEIAHGWEFSEPFEAWNVTGACDLVNPEKGHVASMTRLDGATCKHFAQRPHPIRVYPERTDKMIHDGVWWTDIKPDPIPAQRSLEAWL